MSEDKTNAKEIIRFFMNGFINGYIPQSKGLATIEFNSAEFPVLLSCWKFGLQCGIRACTSKERLN